MQRYKILQSAAFALDIKLHLSPGVFQRHRDNISFFFTKQRRISWCSEFFAVTYNSDQGIRAQRFLTNPVPGEIKISQALSQIDWNDPFLVDFVEIGGGRIDSIFESHVLFLRNRCHLKKSVYKRRLPPNLRYFNNEGKSMIEMRKKRERKSEALIAQNKETNQIKETTKSENLRSENLEISKTQKTQPSDLESQNKQKNEKLDPTKYNETADKPKNILSEQTHSNQQNKFGQQTSNPKSTEALITSQYKNFFKSYHPIKLESFNKKENHNSISMRPFNPENIEETPIENSDEDYLVQIDPNQSINQVLTGTYVSEFPSFYLVHRKDISIFLNGFHTICLINQF